MSRKLAAKLRISSRMLKKKARRASFGAKKHCRFCGSKEQASLVDYKNAPLLKHFLTERGKILPARISGACNRHQKAIAQMIKKARVMALLPYSAPYY